MKVAVRLLWQLLLVAAYFWQAALADTSELICQEEQGSKNGELVCSFRVDPAKPMKDRRLKHCTDDVCVNAVAWSTEPQRQSQSTTKNNHDDSANDDQGDILKVGLATYRKPYSKYYSASISQWLNQTPKMSKIEDPLGWAKWCGTLGSLHVHDYKEPYDLELAINVLQESVQLIEDHFQIVGSDSFGSDDVWESFRASVYNTLGEAYYLNPNIDHGTEALDHYETALAIYESLVQKQDQDSESIRTAEHVKTRQVYALTLGKVGSALIQLHSAEKLEVNSLDSDDLSADMASTTTMSTFNENDKNSQSDEDPNTTSSNRSPKLQRASEVLILAQDIYHSQCKEHLPTSEATTTTYSGYYQQKHIPDPSAYVEACVDFATTLQYASTVESLSGNYPGALDYMKRAMLVYTGEINILDETVSDAHVDSVLSNVYSMWYYMGSVDSIGSLMANIADTYGQLGKHQESKTTYMVAMRFYSMFHLTPPPTAQNLYTEVSMDEATKTMLDSYLSMLKEYRRGTASNADPGQPMYQTDDTYEGDILYNLGTIYLYAGDDKEGMDWFEEAITVYQRTHNTKNKNRISKHQQRWSQIASIKASLKRIYFGQGRFDDSNQAHQESMDLFLELYGDGVNPYVQLLHDQVVQANDRYQQTASQHEGSEEMIGGENSINLEHYLQSIQNATEKIESDKKKDDEKEL
ncbi:unnamed protein product [Cylindrotheca closterium]|uniref:KIF-binding protein n=1 Tax=Cylindrotheca closterium TaxID=2856 RepID=A0AAD2JI35_9STRA|nr:unnamed protein product [Cylindrotheca closterium]